jgi:hypothetical protein
VIAMLKALKIKKPAVAIMIKLMKSSIGSNCLSSPSITTRISSECSIPRRTESATLPVASDIATPNDTAIMLRPVRTGCARRLRHA